MIYIRHEQGKQAEQLACDYLQTQGLQVLERNFRSRLGEIDLIMRDQRTLLFIEVRYRKTQAYGGAAASVTRKKQRRIMRTAQYYLQRHPIALPARFDVIAIENLQIRQSNQQQSQSQIQWIQHAFQA